MTISGPARLEPRRHALGPSAPVAASSGRHEADCEPVPMLADRYLQSLAKVRVVRQQAEQGQTPPPERLTVAVFLNSWLNETARPRIRPRTFRSYEQVLRLYLIPGLGHGKLKALSTAQVQAFLNAQTAKGLSSRTVGYQREVLRNALNYAVGQGLLTRNPASLAEPPRAAKHVVEPLSPAQCLQLLEGVRGSRAEPIYAVAIATGLRQGELLGLRWEDLDLDAGCLHVRRALQRVAGDWQLVEPKSATSLRTLALPMVAISALRGHRLRQIEERMAAGGQWQDWNLVFATRLGRPLDGSRVTHEFKAALGSLGLPPKRFHDLRHSCASLLVAQGVPIRVVMETLGHSDIRLTMNTYSHVSLEVSREAATRIDAVLGTA
jgi:integrase